MSDSIHAVCAAHGLLNAHRAFLCGAQVAERWAGRQRFAILDTHFDAGLNFLTTWRAWRADPKRPQQLHYLAISSNPCTASRLAKLHAAWPEFSMLSQELVAVWPIVVPGFHRVLLEHDDVLLTLIFGDVERCLPQIDARVDTFYLNGTWVDQCSQSSASTTFTLLGRLATQHAMLAMEPASHAGTQAVSSTGFVFEENAQGRIARFSPRWVPRASRALEVSECQAIVIGAGLAGSAACERLAARGWQISLIERHDRAAQEASGNRAGIYMPLLARDDNPDARLSRAAFLFAARVWQQIGGIGHAFSGEACGVLQFARDALRAAAAKETAEIRKFSPQFAQWLGADAVSKIEGMPKLPDGGLVRHGGWFYPQAGWVHPGEVCEALLAACGDRLVRCFSRQASRLVRLSKVWQVYDDSGAIIAQAPHVIVANGMGARNFSQTAGLPLNAVRAKSRICPPKPCRLCR